MTKMLLPFAVPQPLSSSRRPLPIVPFGQGRSSPFPVGVVPPRSPNLDFERCVQSARRKKKRHAKGRILQTNQIFTMTYIQKFEAELKEKLQNEKDVTVLMRWVSK